MKFLLTFHLFFCAGALLAQFTLTYDDHYPEIGYEDHYTAVLNPPVSFDAWYGGANQIWDFSELETGIQLWIRVLPLNLGLASNDFPNAEWLDWSELLFGGDYQEGYLSHGPDGVSFEGYNSQTWKYTYTNPRLLHPFPMDYGDIVTDTWTANVQHQITMSQNNRVGESTFEYDGYGTLILPHITINDVVRVQSVTEYTEVIAGFDFTYTETRVDWYAPGYEYIVASVLKLEGDLIFFPVSRVLFLRNPDDIVPEVHLELTANTHALCENECVTFTNLTDLSIFEDNHELTWQWTFPGGNPETSNAFNPPPVCYDSVGVYPVLLELDVNGQLFQYLYQEEIEVLQGCGPVANFEYTPIICLGQCYNFVNTSSNTTQYFWTFQGASTTTSQEMHPTDICYLNSTGVFNVTLTATNASGTSVSITQQVLVVNPPAVNAGADQTIVQGTTTGLSVLAGNGSGVVIWQPYEDVTCFSCASTSTYPLNETTTFIVYYQQAGGCQSSDTLTVFVEESFGFGIPNSFSPNGDGINDVLYVRGSNITQISLQIFNRYGQMVFETNSQSVGWDGTFNGRNVNPGVFGYILEVYQLDGARNVVRGDLTLIR